VNLDALYSLPLRPPALTKPVPKDLRIGMIGLGRFVQNNVLTAYRAAGYNIVAAADPDPEARERVRSRWSVESLYADYEEMLSTERLDVVDINVRWDRGFSDTRLDLIKRCAAQGVSVQLAKPLGATYRQCLDMVETAERSGILLSVNQNSRYAPSFFACRRLVEAGVVGRLLSASIAWDAARGIQRRPDFDAVHDVSVHQVDVLLSWVDREPSYVFASQSRRTEVGSVVQVILGFPDGVNGSIRDDFASDMRRSWPFVVVGEEGTIDGTDDIEVPEAGQPRMIRGFVRLGLQRFPGLITELPLSYRYAPESFAASMGELLQCLRSGGEPWANGRNVLRTMRTLFAVEESIRTGQPVVPADVR
jgi:predicted dehydrogenase